MNLATTRWQSVSRLLFFKKAAEGGVVWQSLCMLISLAGLVFFLVVAWRFMKAHEALASAFKDTVIGLKSKE
jgi:hypothetical protein